MRIGELSRITSTGVETIRFYEKEGLLPPPERTANNYRAYTPGHLERLLFIRHGRKLGMPLEELRVLLHFKDSEVQGCETVNALLDRQIEEVSRRLEELEHLKNQLDALRQRCKGGRTSSECGILCELSRAARADSAILCESLCAEN
ncbi:Cd(II)/Pb(II)-responsive transcriptional regulator [Orrella marina]|uniref:Cd(II)/Pb(II)-responsive transcriptional regulator n=1 Tax=Orrella marina TaxID=2163011 RepID=A0A2R4XI66_9BURK|nr:Cd(II)/Pb(II)-responsive transcriptional regulator [Orrella marina]AWB33424.1 Cd(II)/Pb(II)-responsive transcriptional regulator [Orrella marina]